MACKKGIRHSIEAAKKLRKKPKPVLAADKLGDITAVSIGENEFCYLRKSGFGHAVLPFLSRSIQGDVSKFPSLVPVFFVHMWVYWGDPTPMAHIANLPFTSDEQSWGPPMYYPPDPIEGCFKIHGMFNGVFLIIKPASESDILGLEEFRRYQPPELRGLLHSKRLDWDYILGDDLTAAKS